MISVAALHMAVTAHNVEIQKLTKEGRPWYTARCELEELQGMVLWATCANDTTGKNSMIQRTI